MKNFLQPNVHVLIEKDEKFLFLRRYKTGSSDGYWCLPSGKIENCEESPIQAAKREGGEEIGLKTDPAFVVAVPNIRSLPLTYYMSFFFACKTKENRTNCESQKHDKMERFSLDDLPNPLIPLVNFGIECYLKKQTYGEFSYE